ncbi:MAG TPA: hypothetical protein PKO18_07495, partial [Chitinophagales bacterium]|nr:hypothetical protein [Chitinophagales bacterium]
HLWRFFIDVLSMWTFVEVVLHKKSTIFLIETISRTQVGRMRVILFRKHFLKDRRKKRFEYFEKYVTLHLTSRLMV